MWKMDPIQALTSDLCLHYRPETVHVQKMRTPLKLISLHYNFGHKHVKKYISPKEF